MPACPPHADARPPAAASKSGASACPYRYVVTDGRPNNVVTYKRPRGRARQGSIHPNERFVVFFGSNGGTPSHVGARQLTDHGWVTFPRPFLRADGRCGTSQQSFQDAQHTFQAVAGADSQAIRDVGQSLTNAAHAR